MIKFKDKYNQIWKIIFIDGEVYVFNTKLGIGLWNNGNGLETFY